MAIDEVSAIPPAATNPVSAALLGGAGHATAPAAAVRTDATRTASRTPAAPAFHAHWRRLYARRLMVTDFLVISAAVLGAQFLWFGTGDAEVAMRADSRLTPFSYWAFSVGLIVMWMWVLGLVDSRSDRVVGAGSTEYVRIGKASLQLFGGITIVAFLLHVDLARGYLVVSLPFGLFGLLITRWLWRNWLVRRRAAGDYSARAILVGSHASVMQIAHQLQRESGAGYTVVGACLSRGPVGSAAHGMSVPILGDVDAVHEAMAVRHADTVIVTSTGDLPPRKLKELSWSLEAGRQHLVLAPNLVDIAGPRIHTRPVAGLPLIHVETPTFSGGQLFIKRFMDLIASAVGIVALSPLLLVLAILVRASGPGPVLFRQTRVGLRGQDFTMLKFRSMIDGAEARLAELRGAPRAAGNEVLFKMASDPRVTPIGRFLRKHSLDELPQLFNVLGGSMAIVGPRPPLPREVEQYATHVHRRFLVKPGITGLWQVSGRSTLSWEESVRLDLSYVENWSLLGDTMIVLRTCKTVVAPGGTAA